jgi:hypothetical protein
MFPDERSTSNPRQSPSWRVRGDFDVFIAMPMSTLNEGEYRQSRGLVLDLISVLKETFQLEGIYFAGEKIQSTSEFSQGAGGVLDDLDALRRSKRFWFVYPQSVVSSALIETGYAMALGVPLSVFVRKGVSLPYVVQQAALAPETRELPRIAICEYKSEAALIQLVRQQGATLLQPTRR